MLLILCLLLAPCYFIIPANGVLSRCRCMGPASTPPVIVGGIHIYGAVTDNGEGVAAVKVSIGGQEAATTDASGAYNVSVLEGLGRYSVNFEPAAAAYVGMTEVVNVPVDFLGGVRVDVAIEKGPAVTLDGAVDNTLDLTLFSLAGAVTMEFPVGVFPAEQIVVHSIVWRSDDLERGLMVPGDFKSQQGEQLVSEGIFSMTFTDSAGAGLAANTGCKLVVDSAAFMNIPDLGAPGLWGLNTDTGFWDFNADLLVRQDGKLEAEVVLAPNVKTFNIDYRFPDMCLMKVAAYTDNQFTDRVAGVQINFIESVNPFNDRWAFTNSAKTGSEGACVRVLCCTSLTCTNITTYGLIGAVTEGGEELIGADSAENMLSFLKGLTLEYSQPDPNTIRSRIAADATGPVYTTMEACQSGTDEFKFYPGP